MATPMTEEQFDQWLDENYGPVSLDGMEFWASGILKALNLEAYEEMKSELESQEEEEEEWEEEEDEEEEE